LIFCREHDPQLIGIGWRIRGVGSDKREALRLVKEQRGKLPTEVKYIISSMKVGDHAWVYDKTDGSTYVCRITSDWKHADGDDWDRFDIHNFREAIWHNVPKPLVLGAITRRITNRGTANKMHVEDVVRRYSALVFEKELKVTDLLRRLNVSDLKEELRNWTPRKLFTALDEYETEDVVGLYLQEALGWRMLKSSAYPSHPKVECQFQKVVDSTPQTAYMQVKSGKHVSLNPDAYAPLAKEGAQVFLFSTALDPYIENASMEGVHTLSQESIRSFTVANLELLPSATLLKLGIFSEVLAPTS